MRRALGEEFGLVGRWLVGVVAFALVAGFASRIVPAAWAAAAGLVAALATIDLLKKFRDDIAKCPRCRKRHDLDATVCPYCQHDLTTTDA